ncbi:MAG: hypothetical protein OEY01_03500 [Desulfobulbaceae bacterium]|nr:hypothetical protein [Desulfobulbaceae bacterium]
MIDIYELTVNITPSQIEEYLGEQTRVALLLTNAKVKWKIWTETRTQTSFFVALERGSEPDFSELLGVDTKPSLYQLKWDQPVGHGDVRGFMALKYPELM